MQEEKAPEERIKEAAKKVFTAKGFAGARMAEIADEAKVNKAMLNYYFRSKQQLFEMIFEEKFRHLFGTMLSIMFSEIPFEEKVRKFVRNQIEIVSEFPELPIFILNEIRQNPKLIDNKLKHMPVEMIRNQLKSIFQKEVDAGNIRPMPFENFMMNMMSLTLFPFAAGPIFRIIYGLDDKRFEDLIEQRKTTVAELLLNDILIKK